MKSHILYIIFLFLGFTACDSPGTDILYIDAFLELDAATTVTGQQTFTYKKQEDGLSTPSGFIVNLAAAQLSEPTNFTFEIDGSSTAIAGEHYELTNNMATIPANASTTELPIEILDDNLVIGESRSIVIKLISNTIPVNPNYEIATHIIEASE